MGTPAGPGLCITATLGRLRNVYGRTAGRQGAPWRRSQHVLSARFNDATWHNGVRICVRCSGHASVRWRWARNVCGISASIGRRTPPTRKRNDIELWSALFLQSLFDLK